MYKIIEKCIILYRVWSNFIYCIKPINHKISFIPLCTISMYTYVLLFQLRYKRNKIILLHQSQLKTKKLKKKNIHSQDREDIYWRYYRMIYYPTVVKFRYFMNFFHVFSRRLILYYRFISLFKCVLHRVGHNDESYSLESFYYDLNRRHLKKKKRKSS